MCSPYVKRSLYKGGVTGFGEPTAGDFTNSGDVIGKVPLKIIYTMHHLKEGQAEFVGWTMFHAETIVNVRHPRMGDIISHGLDGTSEANSSHIGIFLGNGLYLNATVTIEPNAVGHGFDTVEGVRTGNVMIKFIPKTIEPGRKVVFRSID